MTGTQSIESQDITVGGIFQAFYAVPDYQREYVWKTAQVEQLLSDILSEMPVKPSEGPPAEYFIGSIVVCPNAAGVLDLIDGQQRMTTLFVTLRAIRDRPEALKDTVETPISGQLSSQRLLGHGKRGVTQGYIHIEDGLRIAAERVAACISDLLDGKRTLIRDMDIAIAA